MENHDNQPSNAEELFGTVPSINETTVGRGSHSIGNGISQNYSIPRDEVQNPPTRSNVPKYKPD